jgi:hypothetical protein
LRVVAERRRERRAPPTPALILRLLPHGSHMERRGGIGDEALFDFGFVGVVLYV